MKTALNHPIHNIYIYNNPNLFMIYWWVIYSYLNNEPNQIGYIELINAAYGSSG